MRILTILSLAGIFGLAACSKSGKTDTFSEEQLATNPAANFASGVITLQSPDRKTGAVDYALAYKRFNASANLGGGPRASFNAGWVSEKLGNLEQAEEHYRAAYEADKTYQAALFSLARVLGEQDKHAEAVTLYKGHAESNPDDLEARNDLIAAYVRAGQSDEAMAEAQSVLRYNPDNASVYRNLSAMYYAQSNYSMSQLTAEKALELNDSDPGVYNNMGVTFLIQGDEPAAIEKFKTALKIAPTNFEANMNLGYTALNSGDYTLALTSFQNALKDSSGNLDAKLGHAVALRGTKEYKAAGEIYDEIIAADPSYEAAYFNAATLHEKYTKDFKKAMGYLQAYIDAHPGEVSPTHQVFAQMERVRLAQEAEEERKRQEAERIRLEKERERRNEELLENMGALIVETGNKLETYRDCLDPGSIEEVSMILEQAQMVVDAKDVDLAQDIQQLMDAYVPAVDAAIEGCEPSAPAAPAEGGAPADESESGGEEEASETETTEEAAPEEAASEDDATGDDATGDE